MSGRYRSTSWQKRKKWRGFTIVELLIVVVVVAILAAITVVAYNGITTQAKESALKADLRNAATQLNAHKTSDGGDFPSIKPDYVGGNLSYLGSAEAFCVFGEVNNRIFYADESGGIAEGICPPPATMQAMTPGHCALMPTYTGSNPEAALSLTDSRGGIARHYEVAKLADNKCWMLTNLKLGSVTSDITLTPSDSNISTSFTLSQLTTSGASDLDLPRAYGPVSGDTSSGAANYGYLYNWPAATAGATRATTPSGGSTAVNSICPAGWRLPTSRTNTGHFGSLDRAFGGTGSNVSGQTHISNWLSDGPFKGVLSGRMTGAFGDQGAWAYLWSASTPSSASRTDQALGMQFRLSNAYPAGALIDRSVGLAIRCVLG